MNLLTIIFGGLDHKYLERFDCPALKQKQWGKVIVDGLHNQRDVATQITAQLITGKTWKENVCKMITGKKTELSLRINGPFMKTFSRSLLNSLPKCT